MSFKLLERRKDAFALWVPGGTSAPRLIIGTFKDGEVTDIVTKELSQTLQDLWELSPERVPLRDGIYHYWFEVDNTKPGESGQIKVTDPLAYTVDYRIFKERSDVIQPPAVIKYRNGKLWPCDLDGEEPKPILPKPLPANNHMVIYELPTSWAKPGKGSSGNEVDRGTFTDVLALFDKGTDGVNFASINAVKTEAILSDLGINALELLPIADTKFRDEWGYATAHYFAPDADLGTTASLIKLIEHIPGRLILDTVMAFGRDPYVQIAFKPFHLVAYNPEDPSPFAEKDNPDSKQSHDQGWRNDYGGKLWRYLPTTKTYNPETGQVTSIQPSWAFHKAHLHRWLLDFGVSGFRLDSINNVANYKFIKNYRDYAWTLHQGAADKFIVIGEELSIPKDLLSSGTLDALWNEPFKGRLRSALLGESTSDNFEWTIMKMIDCTLDGFKDGAQAVNYVTSHDVEGMRNERLYNFLINNRVADIERRAKLAFACLLTAVGIPMIFAGEEFCDEMDHDIKDKQTDPVNYERKNQADWRRRVFDYVARLVDLRKNCPALGVDETSFIHVDNSRGGKIMAWKRGTSNPVIVVANFTDQEIRDRYHISDWPDRDRNDWREITQGPAEGRPVPAEWVGRSR